MRKNKLFVMLVAIIIALSAMMMVACPDEPEKVPGPETGSYYCEVGGTEYTVSLFDVDRFAESTANGPRVGTYVLNGNELTLTYPVKEKGAEPETKVGYYDSLNRKVTLPIDGVQREYLEIKSFDVTFNLYDDRTETQTVKNGKSVLRPEDPIRDGYEFMGWYTAKEGGERYQFNGSMILSAGTTVYAHWRPVSTQKEFVIDFDLGYEATAPAAVNTVNGKLFDKPSDPTREGYTFAGWWISDYEDGAKLTVKYEEGREFKANTTLFAVWTANGNEQPVVSVNGSGISWVTRSGTVKVTVKGPKGFTALEQDVNGTVMAVNFGSAPAGDYEITVIDGSKSTTVYYRNKALDRVSRFSVDGSVLRYDGVANATRYYVSVVCGNEKHNHAYIDNDNKLYFDFTDCTMVREGIKFVVTAHADGYADSVSEEYVCIKELAKVEGFAYDKASGKLSWNSVENARSYVITVNGKATALTVNEYSFKGYAKGEYEIKVSAFAKGYAESVASEYSLVKNELSTPSNVKLANSVLSWDGVEGAQNYTVRVGNTEYEAEGTSYDLSGIVMVEAQDYEIVVRANAASASENSAWSDVLDARYHALKDSLTYRENKVRWTAVIGAEKYEVKVNNGAARTVDDGSTDLEVALTRKGVNEITVRYYDGMRWSKTVSVEVVAYMVRFDARNDAHTTGSIYVAIGDKVNLPVPENLGYEFDGWYNTYGGAESNGARYEEVVYSETRDMVLYGGWKAKTYTITKVNGDDETEVTAVYGQPYDFGVAVSTDDAGMFVGWFTAANGGVQLTDSEGKSIASESNPDALWLYPGTDRVYAHFSNNVLEFTLLQDGTYQVSKGPDIGLFTTVTVPATYKNAAVTVVAAKAFSLCTNLVEVNIPNTVTSLVSAAFDSSRKIEAVNIYDAGAVGPKYYSDNGVLYTDDIAGKEISYYPYARVGEYEILPGTVRIVSKVFYNVKSLTEVVIPSSVGFIGQSAFYGCESLNTVNFAEPESGDVAIDLQISKYAFQSCKVLKNVTLPARLQNFESTIFTGCISLENVNIAKGNAKYSSKNGIVTNASGDEIIYCPNGKSGTITIPTGVISIAKEAFKNCDRLTSVTFPYSVTDIGESAFVNCSRISRVKFNGSPEAQPVTIGKLAFSSCYNISELVFEDDSLVTVIGAAAFEKANGLRRLVLPVSVQEVMSEAFRECRELTSVEFAEGVISMTVSKDAFAGCMKLTEIVLPSTMSEFPAEVINNTESIRSIVVPASSPYFVADGTAIYSKDNTELYYYSRSATFENGVFKAKDSVTRIHANVFSENRNIKKVVIGKNIEQIDDYAFANMPRLVEIEFEEGTKPLNFGVGVFSGNAGITTFAFPERAATIGEEMFKGSMITSISIGKGIVSIGDYAFKDCAMLTTINFAPDGALENIGNYAFNGAGITSVTFPDSLLTIGASAFGKVSSLVSVEFSANSKIKVIEQQAFEYTSITSVYLPATLEEVGQYVFRRCEKLAVVTVEKGIKLAGFNVGMFSYTAIKEIEIPNTMTYVGTSAFANCASLEKVTFEAGGTEDLVIGLNPSVNKNVGMSFNQCTALTSVHLPSRLVELGSSTFNNAKKLSEVTFVDKAEEGKDPEPSRLVKIGSSAFASACFAAIDIPDTVETIETNAFKGNTKLKSIEIPASVLNKPRTGTGRQIVGLGTSVFEGCTALTTAKFNDNSSVEGMELGITFSDKLFYGCTSLTTVNFPSHLKWAYGAGTTIMPAISDNAFYNCKKLTTATSTSEKYKLTEGVIYEYNDNGEAEVLRMCLPATTGTVTIPYTVKTICANAFANCASITSIVFEKTPSDKTEVPLVIAEADNKNTFGAFTGTTKLTSIELPERLVYIGAYAFNKSKLTSITIPASVCDQEDGTYAIGDYAFAASTSLAEVTFPTKTVEEGKTLPAMTVGYSAFSGCTELTTLDLGYGVTSIGGPYDSKKTGGAFESCKKLKKLSIPASVTFIGQNAFKNCTVLAELTFDENVHLTKIDNYAFIGCKAITTFNMPIADTYLTTLTYTLFGDNTTITKLVIPKNFTGFRTNDARVLSGFNGLTEVEVEAGNKDFMAIDGVLYRKKTVTVDGVAKDIPTELLLYPVAKTGESFTIPSTVTVIGGVNFGGTTTNHSTPLKSNINTAFSRNASLKTLTVPSSVTTIGDYAFYGMRSLTSLNFEQLGENDELNELTFGKYSVGAIAKLTSFTVPARVSINGLGEFMFSNSTSLAKVELIETAEEGKKKLIPRFATVAPNMFNSTAITTITLPKSVTTIGKQAFYNCKSLTSVIYEEGCQIETFGDTVFSGCTKLTTPASTLIKHAKTLGSGVFTSSAISGEVTIPEGITELPQNTFNGNTGVTKVILPSTLTKIGSGAFRSCTKLEEVVIPNGVTAIDGSAFHGCSALKRIVIPTSVVSLGTNMFQNCSSLEEVVFGGNKVTNFMFSGCSKLKKIELKEGVLLIGTKAFMNCSSLEEITIPSTVRNEPYANNTTQQVTGIGESAFEGCSSIKTVVFTEGGVDGITIGTKAFYGCSSIESVVFAERLVNGTKRTGTSSNYVYVAMPAIGDQAFDACEKLASITNLGLVEGIGDYAFRNTAISEISIPSTLLTFGASPFMGCRLSKIELEDGNPTLAIKDGVVYDKAFTQIMIYPIAREGSVEIPSTVEELGDGVFAGSSLTSIALPEVLTSIGDNAFKNCRNLTSVVLPDSIKSIGASAFEGCAKLTDINLSDVLLETIGDNAFKNCISLNAKLPGSLTYIGAYAFYDTIIENAYIANTVGFIGESAFQDCQSLKTIEFQPLGNGLLKIEGSAFKGCTSVTSLMLPRRLRSRSVSSMSYTTYYPAIGNNAFEGCTSLTTVTAEEDYSTTLADSLYAMIGANAFKDCVNLKYFEVMGGIGDAGTVAANLSYSLLNGAIGSKAFENCTKLEEVVFPDTIVPYAYVSISDDAFNGCSSLAKINLPEDKIKKIGERAFKGTALASVRLTCGAVGSEAFADCSKLASVEIEANRANMLFGSRVFANCGSLASVSTASIRNSGTDYTISLGDRMFEDCSALSSLVFNKNEEGHTMISNIGYMAFGGCKLLTEIEIGTYTAKDGNVMVVRKTQLNGKITDVETTVVNYPTEGENAAYKEVDGVIYSSDETTIVAMTKAGVNSTLLAKANTIASGAFGGIELDTYSIPAQITTISQGAFGRAAIKKITVHSKVSSIGAEAFANSSVLNEVVFEDGISVTGTNKKMFENCTALTSVTLPFTTIGEAAFKGCTALKSVIALKANEINNYAFDGCSQLDTVEFAATVRAGDYSFRGCGFTDIDWITESTIKNDGTFADNTKLKTVNITDNKVYMLGEEAFAGCSSLETVVLPDSITMVYAGVFKDCVSLKSINLDKCKLVTLGESAFKNCRSLTKLSLESSPLNGHLTYGIINESVFEGCSSLKELILPISVIGYGKKAFKGCTSIRSFDIPISVSSIESDAFSGWTNAQTINCKGRSSASADWVPGWNRNCNAKIVYEEA